MRGCRTIGLVRLALLLALCLLVPRLAAAQAAREGRLVITVVDESNAVIPNAVVTTTGNEDATQKTIPAPVQTTPDGIALVPRLVPGRYNVQAEFPGFEAGLLKDVRVRAGDNKQVIVLAIEKVQQTVTVGQDKQAGAADRQGSAFGTTLTREQMDALSDDPDEMQRQLQDMAGPGAVIRIDSFEGGSLPPKAQIKMIHITRDQFAAENHGSDGTFIDIITQPGVGPVRTFVNYQAHNSAMAARNPLAPTKGSDQAQNYGMFVNGGVIKNRASFALGIRGNSYYDSPILTAALPGGTLTQTLKLKSPRDNRFVNGNFDYAVTRDQTLRMSYTQNDTTNENLGVGGFNLADRAYTNENHGHTFRVQEAGPLGRRAFTNTRFNIGWTDTLSRSALEAPTIRVLDSFTSGGAQVAGGRHSKDANLSSDFDYVRGINSVRAGTSIDANWFHSNDTSNYLGTYTFENIGDYDAGRPTTYTRRIGNPNINFVNAQGGVYIQDDIRVRKSLTLTPGARYEAQTHVKDYNNIGPRLGVTWAPFKNGKTTLRTSWGLFYDWLATTTYEQTLRVDGFRQQELNIVDPGYPNLDESAGSVPPVNRYLLAPGLQNARSSRVSGGVDYSFTPRLRASATYRYLRGGSVLRGLNLNSPIDGTRPNPLFGNVIEVVSDGSSRQHVMQLSAQTPPPPPLGAGAPRWDWKKWGFFSSYTLTSSENNTDGAFSTPADGRLADDWGVASGTVRHRAIAGFTSSQLKNLTWQMDGQASSGTPYTIQTGSDDNGDSIFNDRPAGVARNTARGATQFSMNLYVSYAFSFGPKIVPPGGPIIYGTPAGLSVTTFQPPPQGRFRIGFSVSAQNLTNYVNLAGYSGVLTSPFFGQPTIATNPRRINAGLTLQF